MLQRPVEHTNQTILIAGHWGVEEAAYLMSWSDLGLDLEKPTLETIFFFLRFYLFIYLFVRERGARASTGRQSGR